MEKLFKNSRKTIKNTMLAGIAAVTMFGPGQLKAEVGVGNNKSGIETFKKEHVMRGVDVKQIKNVLSDYEASPGSSFDMFLEMHKDAKFTLTESVGETQIAAKLSAEQKLKAEGKTSRYVFTKNIGNGNVSVILVAVE